MEVDTNMWDWSRLLIRIEIIRSLVFRSLRIAVPQKDKVISSARAWDLGIWRDIVCSQRSARRAANVSYKYPRLASRKRTDRYIGRGFQISTLEFSLFLWGLCFASAKKNENCPKLSGSQQHDGDDLDAFMSADIATGYEKLRYRHFVIVTLPTVCEDCAQEAMRVFHYEYAEGIVYTTSRWILTASTTYSFFTLMIFFNPFC